MPQYTWPASYPAATNATSYYRYQPVNAGSWSQYPAPAASAYPYGYDPRYVQQAAAPWGYTYPYPQPAYYYPQTSAWPNWPVQGSYPGYYYPR